MSNSIYCPLQEGSFKYIDENGVEQEYEYDAKEWVFTNYIETASSYGVKQRVHEEIMLIAGEVINSNVGVDWNYFFDNLHYFKMAGSPQQTQIMSDLQQNISAAILRVDSVIKINSIQVQKPNNRDKRIRVNASFYYNSNNQLVNEDVEVEV